MGGGCMKTLPVLCLSCSFLSCALFGAFALQAADLRLEGRFGAEWQQENRHSPFATSEKRAPLQVNLDWQDQQSVMQGQVRHDEDGETSAHVNQLYLYGQNGEWGWSAGRLYLPWDMGYGLRPLDLFGREEKQDQSQGGDLIQGQYWLENGAVDLVCASDAKDSPGLFVDESRCAARWFGVFGDWEWQSLLVSTGHVTGLGGGGDWVARDDLTLFASLLWVPEYQQPVYSLTEQAVYETRKQGYQGEIGWNWNHSSGLGILVSYLYDSSALSAGEWQQVLAQDRALVHQSVAFPRQTIGRLMQQSLLVQQQYLLRLYWQSDFWLNECIWMRLNGDMGELVQVASEYEWNPSFSTRLVYQQATNATDQVTGLLAEQSSWQVTGRLTF